jgi:hypothetical protein
MAFRPVLRKDDSVPMIGLSCAKGNPSAACVRNR